MQIEQLVTMQRNFFYRNQTKSLAFRQRRLTRLRQAILAYEKEIFAALQADLQKSKFESYATEVGIVLAELSYMQKHLEQLARPEVKRTPLAIFPARSYTLKEPYGVTLIISPWNYPFQLTMVPLIGALAAGNCAVVKPSNHSPHTTQVIEKILHACFPDCYVSVVQGGRETNQDLLKQDFDYIFFTGSVPVGQTVMREASRHLTPVTLELGGKSPCIVAADAPIEQTAKRIVWGKFLNAGQTCVAPDYVLVPRPLKGPLIGALQKYIAKFYGPDALNCRDYPGIISARHYHRLLGLLKNETVLGGRSDEMRLRIEPTLLPEADFSSAAMQEEIFGPLLPILTYDDLDQTIALLKRRPKPLALYLFTRSAETKRQVLGSLSYGGGCINDTVVHFANGSVPFGGVGASGMGRYHEAASFDTFSHQKSIADRALRFDVPLKYPPYKGKFWLVKKFLR